MIRITAKRDGFRRAGMAHFGTREHPDGTFSPEELTLLRSETMLVVEVVPESKKTKESASAPDAPGEPEKS